MNEKVVHYQSIREELSSAESSSGQGMDEVHSGAGSVSVSMSRIRCHALSGRVKGQKPFNEEWNRGLFRLLERK